MQQFTKFNTRLDTETLLYAKRLPVRDFSGGNYFTRAGQAGLVTVIL